MLFILGWVGFGLSDNGNMFPGDVIVGWVTNNGSTHFSVRYLVYIYTLSMLIINGIVRLRTWGKSKDCFKNIKITKVELGRQQHGVCSECTDSLAGLDIERD